MRAAGVVLVVAGLALVLRCAALLAGRGRPQRGPRPAFVVAGPYVRVRNPLLGGMLLALAGVALATGSPAVLDLTVLAAVAAHVWVTRVEEPRLAERFGPAYGEYLRRVPRWLPARRPAADRQGSDPRR